MENNDPFTAIVGREKMKLALILKEAAIFVLPHRQRQEPIMEEQPPTQGERHGLRQHTQSGEHYRVGCLHFRFYDHRQRGGHPTKELVRSSYMKTGFLTVSFGTTHLDTLENTITAAENALKAAFPQAHHYRAFTSGVVRSRLKSKYDISVDSVEEALDRMKEDTVLVAGDHSKNDMAGDGPDSLRGMLEQAGFEVTWILRGLGELPAVHEAFARRAAAAYNSFTDRGEV